MMPIATNYNMKRLEKDLRNSRIRIKVQFVMLQNVLIANHDSSNDYKFYKVITLIILIVSQMTRILFHCFSVLMKMRRSKCNVLFKIYGRAIITIRIGKTKTTFN